MRQKEPLPLGRGSRAVIGRALAQQLYFYGAKDPNYQVILKDILKAEKQ